MPRTAELLVASAPRPYTVSVGNATGMEDVRRSSAAFKMFSDSGRNRCLSNQEPRSSVRPDGGSSDLIERIRVFRGTSEEVFEVSMVNDLLNVATYDTLVDKTRFNGRGTIAVASVS